MKNNIRVLVGCVVLLPQVLTYFALRNSYMGGGNCYRPFTL